MAVGARIASALPLAGAALAAVALGGVAVFSVQQASCADPGRYIQHDDGQVELVGSCVSPDNLPPAQHPETNEPVQPAFNQLAKTDRSP